MNIEHLIEHIRTILNFIKTLFISKFRTIDNIELKSSTLTILANGPSLNKKLKSKLNFEGDVLVVNSFHKSSKFLEIKPKYYLVSAPEFWIPLNNTNYQEMQLSLERALKRMVSWNMIFFIPYKSKSFGYKSKIENLNPKIKVQYYNDSGLDSDSSLDRFLMTKKLAMPRPHNVLIPSIMTGIWVGYTQIKLYGVDHSWLPEIKVNKQNKTLINQKHFYDLDQSHHKPMTKSGRGERHLHEILFKFYLSFKAYHNINSWAKKKGVKITNKTNNSFIDAFDRDY